MTKFTVKVRADRGDEGSNKIEVFLDTEPKQEIMVLTTDGNSLDDMDEEVEQQDVALYYAVERIAQLEAHIRRLISAGDGMYTAFDALMPGLAKISLKDYSVINDNPIEWQQAKKAAQEATDA